jgi:heat shock 70kDa protein 4
VKKKEIPIIATNSSLDKSVVESYRELESQIHATDKLVMDTEVDNLFSFSF